MKFIINNKTINILDAPATGTTGQVLTIDANGNPIWDNTSSDMSNYYTKSEIDEMIPENNLTNIVDGSASGSVRGINTKSEDSSYKMGNNAWAEGLNTMASGKSSHAEGMGAIASGDFSHVEGREDTIRLTLSGDANSLTYTFDYVDEGGANYIASFIFSGVVKLISNNSSDSTTVTNVDIENKTLTVDTTLSTEAISNVRYTLVIYPTASGETSHVEGTSVASGLYAHAEGRYTEASNQTAHAEGYHTTASNQTSHAEGYWATASGAASHAEGETTTASADGSHAEGCSTTASGLYAHAEGNETTASKAMAHAEGYQTTASGQMSHTEGRGTTASATTSHAEGHSTLASGYASHSEGFRTNTEGQASHTEGQGTYASKSYAHAEGIDTLASGLAAHAEGHYSIASGLDSHVEGYYDHTDPIYLSGEANATTYTWTDSKSVIPTLYQYEHLISEGGAYLSAHLIANFERRKVSEDYIKVTNLDISNQTITVASTLSSASAITNKAYYFFFSSIAEGDVSHAENFLTMAKGTASHSEGFRTIAKGQASHAQGMGTIASKNAQSVLGTYNIEDNSTTAVHPLGDVDLGQYAVIVGNGYKDTTNKQVIRSNAHTLDWQGNGWYAGKLTVGSAPTANMDVATKKYVDDSLSGVSVENADWSENDPTSNTYIENRTHYVEDPVITEVWSGRSNLEEQYLSFSITDATWLQYLENGLSYSIIVNENTYTGHLIKQDNYYNSTDNPNSESFYFVIDLQYSSIMLYLPEIPVSTITATLSLPILEYHKLNSKYLNGSLIKSGQGFNSEIFNGMERGSDDISFFISGETNTTTYNFICYEDSMLSDNKLWPYLTIKNHETIKVLTFTDIDLNKEDYYWFGHIQLSETLNAENNFTEEEIILSMPTNDALGIYSHIEGCNTIALGNYSHAEGRESRASGIVSHAEGTGTVASGNYSHAEGGYTTASGECSHVEGNSTTASGKYSHAEGFYTIAQRESQHVFGEYNIADTNGTQTTKGNYIEIVGNGTSQSVRSNARTLDWSGNEVLAGKLTVGTNPTASMDVATKKYVDGVMSRYALKSEIPTVTNDFTDGYKDKVDSLWEDYQTASTKASEAAASATSAQEYNESAQQSAVNAQTSATNAAASEAQAQHYAENASAYLMTDTEATNLLNLAKGEA